MTFSRKSPSKHRRLCHYPSRNPVITCRVFPAFHEHLLLPTRKIRGWWLRECSYCLHTILRESSIHCISMTLALGVNPYIETQTPGWSMCFFRWGRSIYDHLFWADVRGSEMGTRFNYFQINCFVLTRSDYFYLRPSKGKTNLVILPSSGQG